MRAGTTVLAVLAALAAGAVGGLYAVSLGTGSDEDTGESWVSVTTAVFDDARGLSATLEVPDAQAVVLGASRRLTASQCSPGKALASGEVIASVDGNAVVALATRVPLWRDLQTGVSGEDVTAVQEELNRLGEHLTVDGRYGASTAAAVNRLWSAAGAGDARGRIPVTSTAWLPTPEAEVESCEVLVGEQVTGGAFATLAHTPSAIRLGPIPTDLAEGERTLSYSGVSVPSDGSGTITSPEMIDAMAASDTYRLWNADPALVDLNFTVDSALTSPLPIITVPPASVGGTGESLCVETREGARPVTVVASRLGQTYVSVEGDAPAEVRVPAPGEQIDCP